MGGEVNWSETAFCARLGEVAVVVGEGVGGGAGRGEGGEVLLDVGVKGGGGDQGQGGGGGGGIGRGIWPSIPSSVVVLSLGEDIINSLCCVVA